MRYYLASELLFTINDVQLACQINATLSESMEAVDGLSPDQGWLTFRPNLQAYSISVDGDDDGAYLYLRDLKRSRTRVDWKLSSIDNFVDLGGQAIITSVSKNTSTDTEKTFSATLQGFGAINQGVSSNSLILEDFGFRLLEDGDLRLLENA